MWIALALTTMGVGYLFGGLQLALSLFVWGSLVRTVVGLALHVVCQQRDAPLWLPQLQDRRTTAATCGGSRC